MLVNVHFPGTIDPRLKMPNGNFKYNRSIFRLATHDLNYIVNTENDQIKSAIKYIYTFIYIKNSQSIMKLVYITFIKFRSIYEIGKQQNISELSEENFHSSFMLDETLYFTADSQQLLASNDSSHLNLFEEKNQYLSPIKRMASFNNHHELNNSITTSTPHKKLRYSAFVSSSNKSQTTANVEHLIRCSYLTPFFLPDEILYKQTSFFYSLNTLVEEAHKEDRMRCSVIAKFVSFSFEKCPGEFSVFVNCKKCDYINFVPRSVKWSVTCYNEIVNEIENVLCKDRNDDSESESLNFSLKWLREAAPSGLKDLPIDTQKESSQNSSK